MSTRRLDEIDYHILRLLQKNARMSYTEIAENVNLSVSRCQRRVANLEAAGIIKAHATLVCQTVLGLPINVFVTVTLDRNIKQSIDAFEAAIAQCTEVMECYVMTGDADYLLRVVAADLKAYHLFLMEKLAPLDCVASIKASFALKQVVYRTALPIDRTNLGEAVEESSEVLAMQLTLHPERRSQAAKVPAIAASKMAKPTRRLA